ncbi:glycosyltransferase family 2 protein [Elizabethkingia bruuniana]|uniref:Glycosyltransferase family 2 protein n=1 Tax=Elizabethkingia bruuniana TaxID=1756149 RepID=A0A7T7ZWY7_9FLAO|nr:glycosyltransferase family 2 protein [Elizabethkingia bruuniana]KGO10461.1 hypothetical protein KS04_09140 [Elizabethkingia miricola]AQX83625.1 hypothetical protein AYC65_00690 [Elizabethkingia bruuniana]KUY22260.1 hypothetical protein ATB97_13505 [Elizabethkingia bruuniana]OPB62471.1 hypothetical protein BAY12_11245 [Elizabethkingia bruuniana]QDZ63605.1 glycosyltransferase family 2 protein [Elizabethkingia bruuniana]
MNNPFVSVIVPIYNVQEYIVKCVNSLLEQTCENMEYIFVDDYSTDNSFKILSEIVSRSEVAKYKIQLIRHKQNKGVATARNTGLSLAKGKYIASIDPDDWIDPDMLKQMYNLAEDRNADIVWCDYYNEYKDRHDYISQKCEETPLAGLEGMFTSRMLGGMCNKLILRDLFIRHQIRFPDGLNICEDLRVCVQLFYYAERVAHIEKAFYHYVKYRQDSISVSHITTPKLNIEWMENIKGIENFIEEKGLAEMRENIAFLKLVSKQNLLLSGNSINDFILWKNVFPESNAYIVKLNLLFRHRIITWAIMRNVWIIPRLWIQAKRIRHNIFS